MNYVPKNFPLKYSNFKIVLVAGKAGSGKDTTSDHLVKNHKYKKYAFADTLKEFVCDKYNLEPSLCYTQEGKKTIIKLPNNEICTVRELLINEGFLKKQLFPTYFVDQVVNKILHDHASYPHTQINNIVISDFRFHFEYEQLKLHFENIITINISRNDCEKIDSYSETSLENFTFDHVIYNNRSLDKLYFDLDNIWSSLI